MGACPYCCKSLLPTTSLCCTACFLPLPLKALVVCRNLSLTVWVTVTGKMGVHFSADSSGILKVDKAESVIEAWENYEVEVPVEAPKENITIEARQTLEGDGDTDNEVRRQHACARASTAQARSVGQHEIPAD